MAASPSSTRSTRADADRGGPAPVPHSSLGRRGAVDQQILNAILIGYISPLFAAGYTLVFGVLDILNLAHSAVFMLGAAVTYSMVVNHGQPFWLACILGIAACAVLGLVIEHVCLRPLRRRQAPPIAALISTIGLALIIVAAVEQGQAGSAFAWLWVDGPNS